MLFLVVAILLFQSSSRLIHAETIEERMCGFEQKCSGNITARRNIVGSCCKLCECTDICKEKDTCCNDAERLNETEGMVKQECLSAFYSPFRLDASRAVNTPKYFTRSRCPTSFKDLEIKESCENPTSKSLEDISFVSSTDGTIVYKNRFCGICHGENTTVMWREMIQASRCNTDWENMTLNASTVTDFVINQCPLYFKPPDNLDLRSVTCLDKVDVTNQCNETKRWDVYDKELETKCIHTSGTLYYYYLSFTTRIYSNLYCYLCNTKSNTEPSTCKKMYSIRFQGESLLTLINQNIWKESENIDKNILNKTKTCPKGHILDTFFNICRKLHCPSLSVPVNGQCVPYLYGDICYVLLVNLTPLEPFSLSESIKTDLETSLITIQKQLGIGKCESVREIFSLKRGIDKMELAELHVTFYLKPSGNCKMTYIWSLITTVQTSPTYIGLMLAGSMTYFRAVWTNLPPLPGEAQTLYSRRNTPRCLFLNLQLGSTCPRIRLTIDEYKLVLRTHTAADELLFVPGQEESNGTMFVCCDRYITFATGMKTEESIMNIQIALTIVILNYLS